MTIFRELSVLDISTVLAGPSVASFFAELGARVIKIENPTTQGDVTRTWKHRQENNKNKFSAYYASANYGKESILLNLCYPSDRKRINSLIYTSDIVITNFKEGDEQKFGLKSEDILRLNPSCIHGKINGFSNDIDRVAYDVVLQAETGWMYMNGTNSPTKVPVAIVDIMAAHQLKQGILCALIQRQANRMGSIVSCSLEEAAISALVNQASNYLMTGIETEQQGSLHPNIAPYGEVIQCANGTALVLAVGSDKQFSNLCKAIDAESIVSDEKFMDNKQRVIHRNELKVTLELKMQHKTAEQWAEIMKLQLVPAGQIKKISQVMNSECGQKMTLTQDLEGETLKSVKQIAFTIQR